MLFDVFCCHSVQFPQGMQETSGPCTIRPAAGPETKSSRVAPRHIGLATKRQGASRDGKWWEMMGNDGKWWEMMGNDGKWWEWHNGHHCAEVQVVPNVCTKMSSFLPYGFVATVLTRFGVAELMGLLSRMSYKAQQDPVVNPCRQRPGKAMPGDARWCQVLGARCHDCVWASNGFEVPSDQFQNDPSYQHRRHRSVPLSAQASAADTLAFAAAESTLPWAHRHSTIQCMIKRYLKDHCNSFPSFLILRESVDHIFLSEHVSADCMRVDPFMNPYRLTPMKNLMAVHIVKAMCFFCNGLFLEYRMHWGYLRLKSISVPSPNQAPWTSQKN